MKKFVIGIDASNLRRGGGQTHLIEILRQNFCENNIVEKVVIWGGSNILSKLVNRPWLIKISPPELDKSWLERVYWQVFILSKEARIKGCDVLYVPGGSFLGNFRPYVTMSQNLLPFELSELFRYKVSIMTIRLLLLRMLQKSSFHNANGVIFLTEYAKKKVLNISNIFNSKSPIIPHGINSRIKMNHNAIKSISKYNFAKPFKLIYVSCIDMYKHQWHLVEAVSLLRAEGFPLMLNLIGPAYPPALSRLNNIIQKIPSSSQWVCYNGELPYEEVHHQYQQADMGIFASSCENLPIILLEMMAAGLPIACSNRGPMPEILKDGGVYFDPEVPMDISRALKKMIISTKLRKEKANVSYKIAKNFSWERCASDTFEFLSEFAKK